MDDIIVWGETREEHDEVAKKSNLKMNKEKCQFGVSQLVFLGDLLTDEGIKPDKAKIAAINDMSAPTSKQEIQRFLGMVTYLAKWIPDLSEKSAPLRILLDHKVAWQWNTEQLNAFEQLQKVLTTQPVLQ